MFSMPSVLKVGSNTVRVRSTTKASFSAIDGMVLYML
jgi:hypothetical protein